MDPSEYQALSRIEEHHWFYRGKRDLVRTWLERLGVKATEVVALDVGTGTGRFVSEQARLGSRIFGVDHHPMALDYAEAAIPGRIIQANLTDLPFSENSVDVVTALDVLEHVEDDHAAFREMVRVLRPRGFLLINVPALQLLWSDWDVSLHHFRRYSRKSLTALLESGSGRVLLCRYTNVAAFPGVLVYRWLQKGLPFLWSGRLEDRLPAGWINDLLYELYLRPASWSWFRAPVGVSLFAVFQKR